MSTENKPQGLGKRTPFENFRNDEFIVPAICQGQAVEYAFATDEAAFEIGNAACIIRRRREAGEPDHFERFIDPCYFSDEYAENHDFNLRTPKLGDLVESLTTPSR